ncbi:hypothetical protein SUDANB96_05892 [Streptomyces sp. enrichment culture]
MVRSPIRTLVTASALSVALLATGCGGEHGTSSDAGGEIFLQPVAAKGPDPFTESTDTSGAKPAALTPRASEAPSRPRPVSGGTPGLYGGKARTGSCDVQRQIDLLTADPAKARAFAGVEGIGPQAVPGYLRGLTPVVLRADTQVTNHGYRAGRATAFQSVLQSGTAVLVDRKGVPRVRCACGNPLSAPEASGGARTAKGSPWPGYRPAQVVVVTPAPKVITHITIINIVDNTWIERRCGHDARHDRPVRPPVWATTRPPTPSELESASNSPSPSGSTSPGDSTSPSGSTTPDAPTPGTLTPRSPDPDASSPDAREFGTSPDASVPGESPADCVTPTVTVTPGATDPAPLPPTAADCTPVTVTATPPSVEPPSPPDSGTPPEEIGPETVPDTPDVPDGGGLIPDAPDTGSIFGSPTDVFAG